MRRSNLIAALALLALLSAVLPGGWHRFETMDVTGCCCTLVQQSGQRRCCGDDTQPAPPCACDDRGDEVPLALSDSKRPRVPLANVTPPAWRSAVLSPRLRTLWTPNVPAVARTGPPEHLRNCIWLI